MIKNKGITFKLVFYILTSCTLIFGVIFGYNYLFSRRIIAGDIRENAENLTQAAANRISIFLRSVQKVPRNLSFFLEQGNYTKENLLDLLRAVVEGNPEIYGSTISFEPYAFDKQSLYFAPYFYRVKEDSKTVTKFTYLGGEDYQYFYLDWYLLPKELNAAVWSEPYYDKGGGNILMSTYSVPFYRGVDGKKRFEGVVTADVSLERLRTIVSSIKVGKTGYGFLISNTGRIITHPVKEFIMNESLFSIAEERGDKNLRRIARDMVAGSRGYAYTESLIPHKKCWLAYMPLRSSGWSLGVVFPQDELFAGITGLNRMVLILGILGFFILLCVIIMISRSITRPLRVLDRLTQDIADGNLDFELSPVASGDEVGRLADSFIYMRDSLKEYIKELTRATQAKERMESELRIAHDIQMGILPKSFPSLKKENRFDVYAVLSPAKEVGGDFYDFFMIDDLHLCFVIADVSDKGVPAALFMAMTKALIRMSSKETLEPERILERVNKEVCRENESCMFITAFLGVLNTQTGSLCFANAGHNPPYLVHAGGKVSLLEAKGSAALGLNPETIFVTNHMTLNRKDTILTYTDGVTEAFNPGREQFSEERLVKGLSVFGRQRPRLVVRRLLEDVRGFCAGQPQSDDITLMALTFCPEFSASANTSVRLANDHGDIPKLKQAWEDFCADVELPADIRHDFGLAMEETVVNIMSYAWDDQQRHWIEVELLIEGGQLCARIIDEGRVFNPLEYPQPKLNKPMAERPQGGLGIHLARNLVDKLEYKREGSKNILILKRALK